DRRRAAAGGARQGARAAAGATGAAAVILDSSSALLKASSGRMEPRVCREHGLLPLPAGERGGARGFTIEGLGPPHPPPLPAGERDPRCAEKRGRAHHEGLDRNERNML